VHGHSKQWVDLQVEMYCTACAQRNVAAPNYELRGVLPLYYGLLIFAEATSHQARLPPLTECLHGTGGLRQSDRTIRARMAPHAAVECLWQC
jgi:hypothetical protein